MNNVTDIDVTSSTVHSCRDTCGAFAVVMPKSGRRGSLGGRGSPPGRADECGDRPRIQPVHNPTMEDDDDDDEDDEVPPTRCKPIICFLLLLLLPSSVTVTNDWDFVLVLFW